MLQRSAILLPEKWQHGIKESQRYKRLQKEIRSRARKLLINSSRMSDSKDDLGSHGEYKYKKE